MWLPSVSFHDPTLPPWNRRDSKICTLCPASANSIAVIMPPNPPPMMPTVKRLSAGTLMPVPLNARSMRFSSSNPSSPLTTNASSAANVDAASFNAARATGEDDRRSSRLPPNACVSTAIRSPTATNSCIAIAAMVSRW